VAVNQAVPDGLIHLGSRCAKDGGGSNAACK